MAHTFPVGSFQMAVQGGCAQMEQGRGNQSDLGDTDQCPGGMRVLECVGRVPGREGALQKRESRTMQRYPFESLPECQPAHV